MVLPFPGPPPGLPAGPLDPAMLLGLGGPGPQPFPGPIGPPALPPALGPSPGLPPVPMPFGTQMQNSMPGLPQPMPEMDNPTMMFLSMLAQQEGDEDTGEAPDTKPKKPKRKKPTMDDIKIKANATVDMWVQRDQRMDEDLALYRLTKETDPDGGEVVLKNTPYVVVEKAANMIAAQIPTIQVVAPNADAHETAQKVENFLRWTGERWNKTWRRSQLQGSIRHDMAHFLCLRGWVAARMSYDPDAEDNELPIRFRLFDPRQVYPKTGDDGLQYIIHRYWTTYGELIDEWPEADTEFKDEDPTDYVEVTSYYDDWYHCVYTDQADIKKVTAHEYGFVPWVIVTGNGSPIRATTQSQTSWVRECGVSIFHGIRDSYKQLNKTLSQLATQVANAANPAHLYYYDPTLNKTPQPIDPTPGTTNFLLYDRERVDPLHLSANPADTAPLIDSLVDDVQKGSLPSILWGQGGTESGFNTSIMTDAARDQLITVIEAIQEALEQANEYTLMLIRDQHDAEIGFWVRTPDGRSEGGVTISPEEIERIGIETTVRYRDVSPKDRASLAQLAAMLTDKHLISMETAREDYLFLENPEREEERVLSDLVKMDEDVIKKGLVPAALMHTDPALFQLYMMLKQQELAASSQPPPGPAGPPTGPPGLPPPPGPGLPPNVVPPIGQPGANPLLQAFGSAIGGAGGLGAPPTLPGTGMQSPLGLPIGL